MELFFDLFTKESKTNYFINYFLLYNKAFGCWVDFESELERIVISFDDLISVLKDSKKISKNSNSLLISIADNMNLVSVILNYPTNSYFSCHQVTNEFFRFNIVGADFSKTKNMLNEIAKFTKSFPKSLYRDLSAFSKLFSIYLAIIKDDVSYDIDHSFSKDCKAVINYNYTSFAERFYDNKHYTLDDIVYINGKCDFKKPDDTIVFGIDSNTLIKNNEFFVFTKAAQRSIKNTGIHLIAGLLNKYFVDKVIIFGHSLTTTDKDTMNYILNHCNPLKNGGIKIVIYCFDFEAKTNIVANLKEILGLESYTTLQINDRILLKNIK